MTKGDVPAGVGILSWHIGLGEDCGLGTGSAKGGSSGRGLGMGYAGEIEAKYSD